MQWTNNALPYQRFSEIPFYILNFQAGRGSGKTLSASHWCLEKALTIPKSRGLVMAPTANDLRFTCFEGDSGLISVIPQSLITDYNKSLHIITLYNGSTIRGISGDSYDRVRGSNLTYAWFDEISSFQYGIQALEQTEFALRKQVNNQEPQILITSTPKPCPISRSLQKRTDVQLITATTFDNPHLPESFINKISFYEGTNIGRQEIYAEILDEQNNIFPLSNFMLWPLSENLPPIEYIIDSWDTATSDKDYADYSARCRFGIFKNPDDNKYNAVLLEVIQGKWNYPELRAEIINNYFRNYKYTNSLGIKSERECDIIVIETASSGIQIQQDLARNRKIKIYGQKPENKDKIQRANFVAALVEKGLVYLLSDGDNDDTNPLPHKMYYDSGFIDQVCYFPNQEMETGLVGESSKRKEPYDDMVDAFSYGLRYLRGLRNEGWLRIDEIPERVTDEIKRKSPWYG